MCLVWVGVVGVGCGVLWAEFPVDLCWLFPESFCLRVCGCGLWR